MKQKFSYLWLLLLLPLGFLGWYYLTEQTDRPLRHLPYFGPKKRGPAATADTAYHMVPPFSFIDQDGKTVNEKTVAGKIYITEFFFSTCQSICPVMNDHLGLIHRQFSHRSDFMILSHTVDPETDSVPVLKAYAQSRGFDKPSWRFLTGPKKDLYQQARKGYLLNAEEGNGGAEDFIHTQNFALVDKERRIRGFYDGTDSLEMTRLVQETKLLLQEYDHKTASR